MKNYLILIDGPKGSGKSTIIELLKINLLNTEYLSLDKERKLLDRTDSISNDNLRAFEKILEKLMSLFIQNINVVLDCGLSGDRIKVLEELAKNSSVEVLKFALIAPKNVLKKRVQQRDKQKGKEFNEERFECTFNAQQSKSFDDFVVMDSSILTPREIFEIIYSKIE